MPRLPHALRPADVPMLPGASQQDTEAGIDAAIASLRQLIRKAYAKILDLWKRRNAAAPLISRLPTELLAEIFLLFEHQYCQDSFAAGKRALQTHFGWLVVTHVCRHWRSVARALPHVWSDVPMSHDTEPMKMFLSLSGGVPLSIIPRRHDYEDELRPAILSLLIPEVPRIRSLHLRLCISCLQDLSVTKPCVAPLLGFITLEAYDDCARHECALALIRNASLPALWSVSLTTLPNALVRAFLRPTLTTLTVRLPDETMSIAEWVDMLAALPLLESLVLEGVLLEDSLAPTSVAARLEMRRLARVELLEWEAGMQCAYLLAHLSLPSCRTLALSMRGSAPFTSSEFHLLFSSVSSALGSAFPPQSASLQLNRTALSVRLWRAALPLPVFKRAWGYDIKEPREPSEHPAVALDIDALGVQLPPDMLPTLVNALPLAHVRALRLGGSDYARGMRPLAALQNVETLLYVSPRPVDLLRALSASSSSHPSASQSTPALFPKLKHLALRHAKWHAHGGRRTRIRRSARTSTRCLSRVHRWARRSRSCTCRACAGWTRAGIWHGLTPRGRTCGALCGTRTSGGASGRWCHA